MEDLIPELQGFVPRASTSSRAAPSPSSAAAAFAIDPALAGPGPASTAARARRTGSNARDAYWDDEDASDDPDGSLFGPTASGFGRREDASTSDDGADLEDEDASDDSEDETDAEDEFHAAFQGGAASSGSRRDKGKGRAVDEQDQRFQLEDEGEEDLEWVGIFGIVRQCRSDSPT